MATTLDRLSSDVNSNFMDFLRHVFAALREITHEYNRRADLNLKLETYYHFVEKLENYYDFDKQEAKKPGERMPFDISACKSFATKEIEKAFNENNIKYVLFTNADKTYIITDSDDATRAKVNKVKIEAFKDMSMSPRLTKADLYADNAGRDIVVFNGFTKPQIEEFGAYAQKQGFFYAAMLNEYGTYSIHISKDIVEMPAFDIQKKVNEISAFESHGLEAEMASLYAKRKAAVIDEAIKNQRTMDPTSISAEKTYIIDLANPGHYITMNGNTLTVTKDNKTQIYSDGEHEQRIYNECASMKEGAKISETQFKTMYSQDALNPAARMQFAKDNYALSKAEVNNHLLNSLSTIVTTKGIDFDVSKVVVEKMKEQLKESKDLQDAKLLTTLERMPPSADAVKQMLSTNDALRSGCTNDIALAKVFGNQFNKAVASIVAQQVVVEKTTKDLMKALEAEGKIYCGNMTPETQEIIVKAMNLQDEVSIATAKNIMSMVEKEYSQNKLYDLVRADHIDVKLDDIIEDIGSDTKEQQEYTQDENTI